MKSCQMYRFIPIMLLCVCLFTGGCSQNKDQPSATHNQTPATEAASHTDHTPQVLTPQADGTKTFTTDTAVIDISHTQEGYIMAKYTVSNAKPKLQLTVTARTLLHISTILNHYMLGFIIAFLVLLIICMILYHTDLGRVLFLGQKLAMTLPQDAFQTACIWFSPADSTVISVLPRHANLSIIRICRHLSTNVTRISATGNHSTKHCCCPASFPRCTPAGL